MTDYYLFMIEAAPGGGFFAIGQADRNSCAVSTGKCVRIIAYGADGNPDRAFGKAGVAELPIPDEIYPGGMVFSRAGDLVLLASGQKAYQLARVDAAGSVVAPFGAEGALGDVPSGDVVRAFLRDLEDRWLIVTEGRTVGSEFHGALLRYRGERPQGYPAIEFFNTTLGHYFVTAATGEIGSVDGGGAGPGWQRTGESFQVWTDAGGVPVNAPRVCRFYGTPGRGPNSHFYSVSGTECERVKQDPGWAYEGLVFALYPLLNSGDCPDGMVKILRAYNNGFRTNDSNHRYTASPQIYQKMIQQGWSGEGGVFCAPAG